MVSKAANRDRASSLSGRKPQPQTGRLSAPGIGAWPLVKTCCGHLGTLKRLMSRSGANDSQVTSGLPAAAGQAFAKAAVPLLIRRSPAYARLANKLETRWSVCASYGCKFEAECCF